MLKQILEDMYIDPELLEMLSDDEKELLFRKMREEQVKMWKVREGKLELQEKRNLPKRTSRKVDFMLGADKKPWVWVMGEARGDLPYEELVKKHEQEQLEKQRKQEEEDRRKAEELALMESQALLVDTEPNSNGNNNNNNEVFDGYSDVVESRDSLSPLPGESPSNRRLSIEDIEVLQKQRAEELFTNLKETRLKARKKSAQLDEHFEKSWIEQEKKAKSYELKRKRSFITAKEKLKSDSHLPEMLLEEKLSSEKKTIISQKMVTRKKSLSSSQVAYHYAPVHLPRVSVFTSDLTGTRPNSRDVVVRWFRNLEKAKGVGLEPNGTISEWMHGLISRADAEELLRNKPIGSFLVRVSVKIWGYTISVKGRHGVQHFMISTDEGRYQFVGGDMNQFRSFKDLLDLHQTAPITARGGECLVIPCGQCNTSTPDYHELYNDESDDEEDGTVL